MITINLGDDIGEITLVTVGDSAFPGLEWLIKGFNDYTKDPKERIFNKKLCKSHARKRLLHVQGTLSLHI